MAKKKGNRYSAAQRRSYYIGYGVGLTDEGPSDGIKTSPFHRTLTNAEKESYINGYAVGLDSTRLMAGLEPFKSRKKRKK